MTVDYLFAPAAFMRPDRVVQPLSWAGHIPFAFWLVAQIRPKVLVELGTHTGNSYFAFCQSVAANRLSTRCHAVDTWQGDEQAGSYDDGVYAVVSEYNDAHFRDFSRLHRSTFDMAASEFENGSIDLLHIDGLHTYEAVRHDYETWSSKLSSAAVVLFHDTAVVKEGFGVRRFWAEVSKGARVLEFSHANGLGVLFLGNVQSNVVEALLADGGEAAKQLFARLGEDVEIGWDLRDTKASLAERSERIDKLNADALERQQTVVDRDVQIDTMNQTIANRDIQFYNAHLKHDMQVEKLRRAVAAQQLKVAARDATIATQQLKIDERDMTIAKQQGALKNLQAAHEALMSSWAVRLSTAMAKTSSDLATIAKLVGGGVVPRRFRMDRKSLEPAPVGQPLASPLPLNLPLDGGGANVHQQRFPDAAGSGLSPVDKNDDKHGQVEERQGGSAGTVDSQAINTKALEEFDAEFYQKTYPDIAASGLSPYEHYVQHGKKEGRLGKARPSMFVPEEYADEFDPEFYQKQYLDVVASGMSPFEHYIAHGKDEGRLGKPSARAVITQTPEFDAKFYVENYPDVEPSGMNSYDHYIRHGKSEGRLGRMQNPAILGDFAELDKTKNTVLIVNHEGWLTGAPVVGYNLVKILQKKYNVVVLFLGPGPLLEACRSLGAIVVGPVTFPLVRSVLPPRLILKQITDHVPLHFAITNSVESRYMLEALADSFVPTISLVHEFAANVLPDLDAFREAVFWSGETVFSSRITLDNVLDMYPDLRLNGRRLPIIPQGRCLPPDWQQADGGDPQELAKLQARIRPADFPSDGIVVLGVGSVHLRKGVDLFIDVARRLRDKAPDVPLRFVWIGKGYLPTADMGYSAFIADQIKRCGLENHLVVLDEVFGLDKVYEQSNVLVVPSRLDPLPNVAIDALAGRLPVVCFDKTTGLAEILRDAGLGTQCVANYLDTEDMATKVLALVKTPALRTQVVERGALIAAETFDAPTYVARLEALLAAETMRARQEVLDVQTILGSDVDRMDYFLPPRLKRATQTREDSVRGYVRSWQSKVGRRKLFPGFDPMAYATRHGTAIPGADPLADYLRAGKPSGPWNYPVISENDAVLPVSPKLRVGLHVHVYYPDIFPAILNGLLENQIRPDLLISVPNDRARDDVAKRVAHYRGRVEIKIVPNFGRDIGPFLTEFGEVWRNEYDVIGHLHTKKTEELKDRSIGSEWYAFLLGNLIGGQTRMIADVIIGRMSEDDTIGIVFPDDPNVVGWSDNFDLAKKLLKRIGMDAPAEDPVFPVGTMFWARTKAIEPILRLGLGWGDYPSEPLAGDGTVLHAVERLFGVVASQGGYSIVRTAVSGCSR